MNGSNESTAISRRSVTIGLTGLAFCAASAAASSRPLGTSRSLYVSSDGAARFGRKQYASTLPLSDGDVVLTFDDGPLPATTGRVLDALAAEQVQATFFMIGRNAKANPEMVRRVAAAGHTLANHTLSHPWTMRERPTAHGVREIAEGQDAIQQAAGRRIAPFFRFPGFADTPDLLNELSRRGDSVWGTDIWASDWNPMAPEQQLALVMGRLAKLRKGIILMHDIQPQTARMMPLFLQALKSGGYRIVHAVG
ncbi:MAG: polysaccharide deacetylase family protein [Beijerinckiaceae bacterium]